MDTSISVQEDLALLVRAQTLDADALAQVHDIYYTPIFRYIAFRVREHSVAEDLTSEVFIRLLDALQDRQAPKKTLRGWLYGVASRVVSDYYRRHYRRTHTELHESLPSSRPEPDESVMARMTNEQLYEAIQNLTEEQQNVLALRFGYEMPIRDVAQMVGKSEGAVKQLQARAIAALSRHLSPEGLGQ